MGHFSLTWYPSGRKIIFLLLPLNNRAAFSGPSRLAGVPPPGFVAAGMRQNLRDITVSISESVFTCRPSGADAHWSEKSVLRISETVSETLVNQFWKYVYVSDNYVASSKVARERLFQFTTFHQAFFEHQLRHRNTRPFDVCREMLGGISSMRSAKSCSWMFTAWACTLEILAETSCLYFSSITFVGRGDMRTSTLRAVWTDAANFAVTREKFYLKK